MLVVDFSVLHSRQVFIHQIMGIIFMKFETKVTVVMAEIDQKEEVAEEKEGLDRNGNPGRYV